jgi:formylglycine-generating enzyme required for sulfatase activity
MHGNVSEWCADSLHDSYKGAPVNGSAWIDNDNIYRMLRGGSWYYGPEDCRSASRNVNVAGSRYYDLGFRVACGVGGTS